jgi:DNA-directed RNA polymerase III subunit RPC1
VRNAANGIVQMLFGDDGLDPVAMEAKSGGGALDFDHMLAAVPAFFPPAQADDMSGDGVPDTPTFKVPF